MSSIPVDVLQEILEHVDENELATLCRVSKIVCSFSQDVLYREIVGGADVIKTLSQSTDHAKRVRFFCVRHDYPELSTALRNMSSLRNLKLGSIGDDASILDGCTFKLDSLDCYFPYSESLQQFLNSQPSLNNLTMWSGHRPLPPFDEMCLPNLTRIKAVHSWLGILIPGRPVTDVVVLTPWHEKTISLSFFATAPIHSLEIPYASIYPTSVSLLVPIFPSLTNLTLGTYGLDWSVRRQLTVISVLMKKSTIIDLGGL